MLIEHRALQQTKRTGYLERLQRRECMRKRTLSDRMLAIIIVLLFVGAFVGDLAMPSDTNVVQAGNEILIIGGLVFVAIGGNLIFAGKKNDPNLRKNITKIFENNKER